MAKTDSQMYNEWVGRQTPDEFVSYMEVGQTIEQAVNDYVDEQAKDVDSDDEDFLDLEAVKAALTRYITADILKDLDQDVCGGFYDVKNGKVIDYPTFSRKSGRGLECLKCGRRYHPIGRELYSPIDLSERYSNYAIQICGECKTITKIL
jgi:hypothetical protein